MKFTPLKFQIPLAAGGISLMAFNYLQFAVPHGQGLVRFSDIVWAELSSAQMGLYLPLIAIMLVFSAIALGSTAIYLKQLFALARPSFVPGPHREQQQPDRY